MTDLCESSLTEALVDVRRDQTERVQAYIDRVGDLRVSEAIAFLQLVRGETVGRDYGPGLDKVIELLLVLSGKLEGEWTLTYLE